MDASEAGTDGAGAGDGAGSDAWRPPQPVSPYIVVDQFGYRTSAEKVAVLRNPQSGFDYGTQFAPGATYAVFNASSNQKVMEGAPAVWNSGATDPSSGDQAWWFDFSSVTAPGSYFVLDESNDVRSYVFRIADDVYSSPLVQATRMMYYQRDGVAKLSTYAGAAWADGAAHLNDAQCTLYQADGGGVKDVHGGWYEAGDQSKYTNLAASDIIELLRAYSEDPSAFGDHDNIPESGNGVPDVLDQVKWGLDWLARMQNSDGSVLTIVAHAGASPPSTDTSPCIYGPASTSATMSAAAAFAYGSIVFGASTAAGSVYPGYAATLAADAQSAWTWASANPSVTFSSYPALGGREQEVDSAGRTNKSVEAATFLFEATGSATYQSFVDANYAQLPTALNPLDPEPIDTLLEYTKISGATTGVVQTILSTFESNVQSALASPQFNSDPYRAYVSNYGLVGSNGEKVGQGDLFYDLTAFNVAASTDASTTKQAAALGAERYIHYLHGVNPLGLVYLSNMNGYGAGSSVSRFFSEWFVHGSKWDAVGVSQYGPPPGFLVAGPNTLYNWDGCCPLNCAGSLSASLCGSAPLSPPAGQPPQKSYRDFNDGWPLDSWQVTEPTDGYETQYIRLLSKFVR
jgi:hypothetical protein